MSNYVKQKLIERAKKQISFAQTVYDEKRISTGNILVLGNFKTDN